MELEFRPATAEDAETAVPLIYSSGPPAFDFVLVQGQQKSAQEFLQGAFRQGGGQFGFANHTVVTHNRRVVGVGACYNSRKCFAFMTAAVRQFVPFYGLFGSFSVIRRGLQIQQLYPPPHRTKNYIGHLGVSEEVQGHGIGRRLVEHFLDISRNNGATHAVLDVSQENPRAQALYERIGFQIVREHPPKLPGVPGHRRMEMRLRESASG